MKNRIKTLEEGDLESEIEILGEDELADLSKSMNKLVIKVTPTSTADARGIIHTQGRP